MYVCMCPRYSSTGLDEETNDLDKKYDLYKNKYMLFLYYCTYKGIAYTHLFLYRSYFICFVIFEKN